MVVEEVGLKNTMKIEDLSELVIETVRSTVKNIGYEQKGFHWNDLKILNLLQQSPDIAQGVDREGAGTGICLDMQLMKHRN